MNNNNNNSNSNHNNSNHNDDNEDEDIFAVEHFLGVMEQSANAKAKPETHLQKYFRFNELPAIILLFLATRWSIVDFVTLKLALAESNHAQIQNIEIGALVSEVQNNCHLTSACKLELTQKLQYIKQTSLTEIVAQLEFYQEPYWIPIMEFDAITQTMDHSTYRVLALQRATSLKDVVQQLEREYRAELLDSGSTALALDIDESLIHLWIPFEHCVDLYCMYENAKRHRRNPALQTTKRGMLASEAESASESGECESARIHTHPHGRLVEIPDDCLRCKVSQMDMFSSIHTSSDAMSLQNQQYSVWGYLKETSQTLQRAHHEQNQKQNQNQNQNQSVRHGQQQKLFLIPMAVQTLILNYYKTDRYLIVEKVQLINASAADSEKENIQRIWPLLEKVNADAVENWGHIRVGDILDCQDSIHEWYQSVVRKTHPQKKALTVHYIGWSSKYDDVIPMEAQTRYAPRYTHTKSAHRAKRYHEARDQR